MECLLQTHLPVGTIRQKSSSKLSENPSSRTQSLQTSAFFGLRYHASTSQRTHTSPNPLPSQAKKYKCGKAHLVVSPAATTSELPSLNDLPLITYINNQGRIIPPVETGTQASVFAVFDANKKIQYIGFSKDVRNSLRTLMGRRAELCYFYKIHNLKKLDQQVMVDIRKHWFSELGLPPTGNTESYQRVQWEKPTDAGSISEQGKVAAASLKFKTMLQNMKDKGLEEELKNLAPAVLFALVVATLWRPSPAFASALGGEHFVGGGVGGAASTVLHRVTGTEFLTAAWTGLVAGWLHTLSGPDHLAALAPLSIGRTRMESAAVGALWGCGHDAGQVIFGIAFVLLRDKLHLDLFRLWGSRIVGLTLMAIGGMGVYETSQLPIQCEEGDVECLAQPGAVVFATDKRVFSVATFATGIVHGLQPDALLVILPALALPSKVAGAAFLGMFLVGTVMAMGAYTSFIGIVSEACNKRVPWLTSRLSLGASIVAILVGLGIILGEIFGFSIFG